MLDTTAELHHTDSAPPVTVSIVSHGQAQLVRKLLGDLNSTSLGAVSAIVVTLNISEADMLEEVQCSFPLRIIKNPAPKGFGANHNAAFRLCTTPWFLVLNPDIELRGDPIAQLLAHATPRTGLLAPRIKEPAKAIAEPHRRLLTPVELVRRRLRPQQAVGKPAWVAGMFMLARSAAFSEVKGFDEKYFMYVEDADLCARLQLANWQLALDEKVSVIHDARRASRRQWRAMTWHLKSLALWWTSTAFWRTLLTGR